MINLDWSNFKTVAASKSLEMQYIELDSRYIIWISDGAMKFTAIIDFSSELDKTDFEENYRVHANKPIKSEVVTQFEKEDLILKLVSKEANFGESDECEIVFEIPGEFDGATISRYIAGGYANSDAYKFGDRVTAAEIVDVNGVTGYPPGTVLGSYHDENAASDEQGWRFWAAQGGEGECEIEPLGGYGQLLGGLYLRIKFKKCDGSPATKVCANLLWGIKDV